MERYLLCESSRFSKSGCRDIESSWTGRKDDYDQDVSRVDVWLIVLARCQK